MDDGARPSRAIASANPGPLRIPTALTHYFSLRDARSASARVHRVLSARIAPVTQFAIGFARAANVPAATRAGPIRSRLLPRKSPRRVGK
jgi:hypothetical protein